MLVPRPRGQRERVAERPVDPLAVDDREAVALRHVVDDGARVAVRVQVVARGEPLELAGQRRHGVAPRHRVRVLHDRAVVGVVRFDGEERPVGVRPLVRQRKHLRRVPAVDRTHHAVADGRVRGAGRLRHRLYVLRERLLEHRVEVPGHRSVQTVQPDDRFVRRVVVVVPHPARREDEVARRHAEALAVLHGEGAIALDDEPDGRGRVPVGRRDLARPHDLDGGRHGLGGPGDARLLQPWVAHGERAPLAAALEAFELARLVCELTHHGPPPDGRRDLGALLRLGVHHPQREDVDRLDLLQVLLVLLRRHVALLDCAPTNHPLILSLSKDGSGLKLTVRQRTLGRPLQPSS